MSVVRRHNVNLHGPAEGRPIMFAHGFGCDQAMWRYVWPDFADRFRVVLFDHAGSGGADPRAFDRRRHASLSGYADDVLAIIDELELTDVVFVGHSVSAMIGVLAAAARPEPFGALVLVGPSPRYIDDGDYVGGFSERDIEELLESMDSNYLGWSSVMAPVIMGNAEEPKLAAELEQSFCRTDPDMARQFARVTFLSDNRRDLEAVRTPCVVLQCSDDPIAPEAVGRFVAERLPDSRFVQLAATGHCPNLSAPEETAAAIASFLAAA